jgi:uncharacterized SAM-binding protein YcdF (DUF218 family)
MYFIKHLVDALARPMSLALLLTLAACALRLLKRPRFIRWLLICATLIVYLGSTTIVGDALVGPLERAYPPLPENLLPSAAQIVVLGSGYAPHPREPITAAIDEDGLVRITEGIRWAHRLQAAKLIVSGGAPPGAEPPAHGYALLANDLGVANNRLVVLDEALDTAAESRSVARLLGNAPFILITSAYHMPRAVRLMKLAGTQPIPAPTGQLSYDSNIWDWRQWLPSSSGLCKTERALHEYLGLTALAAHLG